MKNINVPYVLLIVLLVVSIASFKAAHNGMLNTELADLKSKLLTEKMHTLEILNAMPAEAYRYQPNKEVIHFADEAGDLLGQLGETLKEIDAHTDFTNYYSGIESKEKLVSQLTVGYELLGMELSDQEVDRADVEVVEKFLVTNANKRGVLQLYLNMKGIK